MNKLSNLSTEELHDLWAKTKRRQDELIDKSNDLSMKIFHECEQVSLKQMQEAQNRLASTSEKVQTLKNKRTKYLRKISSGSVRFIFASALAIIAIFILIKLFAFEFEIVNPVITYIIIAPASFVVSLIAVNMRNKFLKQKIDLINKDHDVIAYDNAEVEADARDEKEIEYIENEKYKAEWEEIERLFKENDYETVKNAVLKCNYNDMFFICFKRFHSNSSYKIKVDGVELFYSEYKKFQEVKLNPGYHGVELVLTSEYADTTYTDTFRYQLGGNNLPAFFVCDEVSGTRGKLREVDVVEFQKECREFRL